MSWQHVLEKGGDIVERVGAGRCRDRGSVLVLAPHLENRMSTRSSWKGICLSELLILACLSSGFGIGGIEQEICFCQSGAGPAGPLRIKRRSLFSVYVERDERAGKLKWVKSEKAAKATLNCERKEAQEVVVPASLRRPEKTSKKARLAV